MDTRSALQQRLSRLQIPCRQIRINRVTALLSVLPPPSLQNLPQATIDAHRSHRHNPLRLKARTSYGRQSSLLHHQSQVLPIEPNRLREYIRIGYSPLQFLGTEPQVQSCQLLQLKHYSSAPFKQLATHLTHRTGTLRQNRLLPEERHLRV